MPTHPIAPPSITSDGIMQQDVTALARPSGSVSSELVTGQKLDGITLNPSDIHELFEE
jgi:hypothetical protein